MDLNEKYREWRSWPECKTQVSDVSPDTEILHFYREKQSHRGINSLCSVRELLAKQVDQEFLDEICELRSLNYLELEVVTASDLSPLLSLPHLRYLKIYGLRNAKELVPLTKITTLRKLFIENSKHLADLNFLDSSQPLEVLGVEGSMYKKQKIATLKPLSRLKSLQAIFLSSVQLTDKNLDYLGSLPNLIYLSCARFAPKSNFDSLRVLMPNLVCNWCDRYEA